MLLVFGFYCKVLSMIQWGFKSTCSNRNTAKGTSCIIVSTVFWIPILFPFPFLFCLGCWWNTFAAEPRCGGEEGCGFGNAIVKLSALTLIHYAQLNVNALIASDWFVPRPVWLVTPRILWCYECRLQREGLFLLKIQTIGHRGLLPVPYERDGQNSSVDVSPKYAM